jgi:uncharacterized protein YdaU (DUF1376 family)
MSTDVKWYKRDPDAALVGMASLTLEECGFYNRIIDAFYSRDGHLPDDDYLLSRIARCNPRTAKRLKVSLFQKQKMWVEQDLIKISRGEWTLNDARTYAELQRNRRRKGWKTKQKQRPTSTNQQPQPQPGEKASLSLYARTRARARGATTNGSNQQVRPKKRTLMDACLDRLAEIEGEPSEDGAMRDDARQLGRPKRVGQS